MNDFDVERTEVGSADTDEEAVAMGHAHALGRAIEADHTILATVTCVVSAQPGSFAPSTSISIATRGMLPEQVILQSLHEAIVAAIDKEARNANEGSTEESGTEANRPDRGNRTRGVTGRYRRRID